MLGGSGNVRAENPRSASSFLCVNAKVNFPRMFTNACDKRRLFGYRAIRLGSSVVQTQPLSDCFQTIAFDGNLQRWKPAVTSMTEPATQKALKINWR